MILPINDKWRIRSEDRQWCVEELRGRGDKAVWQSVSYHRKLEQAANSLLQRRVRRSEAVGVQEVIDAIDRIEKELVQALSWFNSDMFKRH